MYDKKFSLQLPEFTKGLCTHLETPDWIFSMQVMNLLSETARRLIYVLTVTPRLLISPCSSGGCNSSYSLTSQGPILPIEGCASRGGWIVNPEVDIKCLGEFSGNTTATSLATCQIDLPETARRPCIVKVASPNGNLYAAVDATFISGQENVTTLSNLVLVASGGENSNFQFDTLSISAPEKLDAANLASAYKEVVATFLTLVNFSGVRSFVHDALVPAVPGRQVSPVLDKQLDVLSEKMFDKKVT